LRHLLTDFAIMAAITLGVTCLGGLFDIWRNKQPLTSRGVKKALAIGLGLPLAILGFGLASVGIAAAYGGLIAGAEALTKVTGLPLLVVLCLPIIALAIIGVLRRSTR
jgi:hypothetical protein